MKRIVIISILAYLSAAITATDFVAITEILYDVYCDEKPSIMPPNLCEFVELYNANEDEVNLGGWMLQTIEPNQTFVIPEGIIIPPHSCLVIGHDGGDFDRSKYKFQTSDFEGGATLFDFLHGMDEFPLGEKLLLQHTFVLPDTVTTLILKDKNNIVRDSLVYGEYLNHNTLYAPNYDYNQYQFWPRTLWSIQRASIQFKITGESIFQPTHWNGYNLRLDNKMPNHSLGCMSPEFGGSNILPQSWEFYNKRNFIQEIVPDTALSTIDTTQLISDMRAIVKRTYYDAMYRPTLTVEYGISPSRKNIMTLCEYDMCARPIKEWLPIAVEGSYLTNQTFKNNATQYYQNESRPYSEKTYCAEIWENGTTRNELIGFKKVGADLGNHSIQFVSRGNNSNEVKLFYVNNDGLLRIDSCYSLKRLQVTETTDEDGNTKVVYTNQQGQVIMEKIDNATTYYVYNDLNQLCYVLPPLVAQQITEGTHNDTVDVLKKYAYVYKYDNRGNQIYKRLPGCEPVLMVYDKSDLLVMSQTGNQRARGTYWTVYKYDALKRPIYTAEVNTNSNDHAQWINDFSGWYMLEHFSTESQNHPMSSTGYSRSFFHNHSTKLLTVNYYDNYDFLSLMSNSKQDSMAFSSFEDNGTYANAKGLLTGTRTYYLDGSGNYSETVYYYDYRGREIQRRSTNHLGGYDVLSTKYDFSNNITDTWLSQSTNNGLTTTEHYHYTYDHANRPLTTTYTFNNESPIVLQSYHYDELGRVRSRHIHNGIDSVAFCYDIRNQITQIKSSNYEQKYYYNQTCPIGNGTAMPTYNGNISATTWTYGNKTNGYMYYYDKMDRLISNYSILNGSLNAEYLCSERFSYDAHGNITNLIRWDNQDQMDNVYFTYHGNQLSRADDEYDLYSYSAKQYLNNNTLGDDFAYDANGNMIYDKDRGVAAIRYNLLNLPDTIQFTNGNLIIHRYDATGKRLETKYLTKKIATTVPLGNVLSTPKRPEVFYITRDGFHHNIVYTANNNDAYGIEFVHNPEGYIRYYGPEEHYHFYYIKDILGNVRETYVHPEAGYKECIQRMQYYPSGLPWAELAGASEQPWKYNGKEFVEMHGLDEYDSKARWYYPAICRTTTIDPLAEKYYSTSPYAWCGNNPVRFVDPDGKKIVVGTWYGRMFAKLGFNNFEAKVTNQLETLKGLDLGINEMITSLEETPTNFYIEYENNKNNHYNPANNTIKYDPNDYIRRDGEIRPPEAALVHELGHAENDKNGTSIKYNKQIADGKEGTPREQAIEQEKRDRNEVNSIYYENIVREKEGYPQRGYNYSAGD